MTRGEQRKHYDERKKRFFETNRVEFLTLYYTDFARNTLGKKRRQRLARNNAHIIQVLQEKLEPLIRTTSPKAFQHL